MLTKSQILSRLRNAQNSPLEEAYQIIGEQMNASGLTELDMEPRQPTEAYSVTFKPRAKTKDQKQR